MIHMLLMRVPPHHTVVVPLLTIPACHGYSLTSVTFPPTIFVFLLANPHLQSEEPPPVPPVCEASVHLTLQVPPGACFLASDVKTTFMSPVENTLGFFVLQNTLVFPFALMVTLSPLEHLFLSLLLVLNFVQMNDILAQELPGGHQ